LSSGLTGIVRQNFQGGTPSSAAERVRERWKPSRSSAPSAELMLNLDAWPPTSR